VGDRIIRRKRAAGNLSASGLFLQAAKLPVNTPVRVKLAGRHPLEMEGVVRFCGAEGVGIKFIAPTEISRRRLDDLIAEFVPREILGV
jgi:hypothetical protein